MIRLRSFEFHVHVCSAEGEFLSQGLLHLLVALACLRVWLLSEENADLKGNEWHGMLS